MNPPCVRQLCLSRRSQILQQDSDPKHTANESWSEPYQRPWVLIWTLPTFMSPKLNPTQRSWVLIWTLPNVHESWSDPYPTSMSPADLNPTQRSWKELKAAVWRRPSLNLSQLQLFAQEAWARLPANKCRSLTERYRKHLITVVASKDCATNY